jgi:predicted TIM-barrel fold metal-dependent hydrolase
MPIFRKDDAGVAMWYLDDEPWAVYHGNTIERGGVKRSGTKAAMAFDSIDPASYSVPERLALLDQVGISYQIAYPNGVGFSSNAFFDIDDVEQRKLVLRVFNDFFVDVQTESGSRLLTQPVLPIWDMEWTVAEMTRLLDQGIRGFTLTDRPELLGLPELAESFYDPMWDLFNESGAVVNFHVAAGSKQKGMIARFNSMDTVFDLSEPREIPAVAPPAWLSLSPQRRHVPQVTQSFMSNVRIITNLCVSDLFDRFPRLKVASIESGIGWVPFVLETMDYQFDEFVTSAKALASAKRRPSEYFFDHFWMTTWYERTSIERALDVIGSKHVLLETDMPHQGCIYPNVREHFDVMLSSCDEPTRRRLAFENAADLWNLQDLPGLKVATRTA